MLTRFLATLAVLSVTVTGCAAATVAADPAPVPHTATCADYADGTTPANAIPGACYLPTEYHGYPTLDTADYGTDIPRCASDDWNADHVPRCYTERVTDGAVLIIDASDTVIATLTV